ncbi:hypothetical protein [uncultured Aquimarina sp.]|uniref:hypothetical protein n=1 Tax=uncultured Aquimarina sp. TaxID=575652 RepID=UPI002637C1F5|nr:hypothetical protein [uncultured Aquimarina sp.]
MTLNFILYSDPIQEEWNYMDLYKSAVKNGSLLKVDNYNNEVLISKISNELIEKTIESHIDEIESNNYEEELVPLDGGLRIEHNDLIIEHQCCSELNDYQNWEKVLIEQSNDWKEIWIGHPSVFYRLTDDKIEFSEYYDDNPASKDITTKMVFEKADFFDQLTQSLAELKSFKKRVYQIIDNGNYENKEILKVGLIK